jgi:hypothetical protein
LETNAGLGERSSPPPPSSTPPQPQKPPIAADEEGQIRKSLVKEIRRLDAWTNNLIDNGLFDKRHKKLFGKKTKGRRSVC